MKRASNFLQENMSNISEKRAFKGLSEVIAVIFVNFAVIFLQPQAALSSTPFEFEIQGRFSEDGSSYPELVISPAVPATHTDGFCVDYYEVMDESVDSMYYSLPATTGQPDKDFGVSSFNDGANPICISAGQTTVSLNAFQARDDTLSEGTENIYLCIKKLLGQSMLILHIHIAVLKIILVSQFIVKKIY